MKRKNYDQVDKFALAVISSIAQVLFFIVFYNCGHYFARWLDIPQSGGVGWGLALKSYLYVYSFLVVLVNLVNLFFNSKKQLIVNGFIAFFVFCYFPVQVFSSFPNKVAFVVCTGLLGFILPYALYPRSRYS